MTCELRTNLIVRSPMLIGKGSSWESEMRDQGNARGFGRHAKRTSSTAKRRVLVSVSLAVKPASAGQQDFTTLARGLQNCPDGEFASPIFGSRIQTMLIFRRSSGCLPRIPWGFRSNSLGSNGLSVPIWEKRAREHATSMPCLSWVTGTCIRHSCALSYLCGSRSHPR